MDKYKVALFSLAIAIITLELAILSEVVLSDGAPCQVSISYGKNTHVSYGVIKKEN